MTQLAYNILPLSESAVVVEFGQTISIDLNDKALDLAAALETDPFPGFVEAVPAYASTTVFFDPLVLHKNSTRAEDLLRRRLAAPINTHRREAPEPVAITVDFREECALDLEDMSSMTKLEAEEIFEVFLARTYRVYMIGFLPGFAYMGEVDERIAVPRKEVPRTRVPKGSVGIAGKQTGIYPLDSPGGWQIIGRTETPMFDPDADVPCLLKPGDAVRFVRADGSTTHVE